MYSQIVANKRKTIVILFSFFVLIGLLSYLIGWYMGDGSFAITALVFASIYAVWSYFGSAWLATTMSGANEIQKHDNPRLWRTVENLCITNGMQMPRVFVIDDPAPNAFATGRDPQHAIVASTTGLLDMMSDVELEGVIAHELGHVKNYDIRVSLIAFALVAVISLMSDFFLRMSFFGGSRRNDDNNSGGGLQMLLAVAALILAPIAATMLQLALSRKRELMADATGALTTRYPEGLASALVKIAAHGSVMQRQNTSTAHLFFANPLKGKVFSTLFSTHPPIDERIKLLRSMTL